MCTVWSLLVPCFTCMHGSFCGSTGPSGGRRRALRVRTWRLLLPERGPRQARHFDDGFGNFGGCFGGVERLHLLALAFWRPACAGVAALPRTSSTSWGSWHSMGPSLRLRSGASGRLRLPQLRERVLRQVRRLGSRGTLVLQTHGHPDDCFVHFGAAAASASFGTCSSKGQTLATASTTVAVASMASGLAPCAGPPTSTTSSTS